MPLALVNGRIGTLGGAEIELARAADALRRVLDHFLPLGDPADGTRQREQHGEHAGREADPLAQEENLQFVHLIQ